MTKTVILPARRSQPQSLREYLAGPPMIGQRALAAAVGCNQSMISMLVRGTRQPSARLAVKLHAITRVPLEQLLATRLKRRHPAARGDPPRGRAAAPSTT